MDHRQIETTVMATLIRVLKCDLHRDASRQNMPQWDSLKHIEIIFELEDVFGVQFSEDEMANLDSVDRIVERVVARHET